MALTDRKRRFLQLAEKYKALLDGDFFLKSDRPSPYFFNLGEISDGEGLNILGAIFADVIEDEFLSKGIEPTVIDGPAYKAVRLADAVVGELARRGHNYRVVCARKEAKDHGDAGARDPKAVRNAMLLGDLREGDHVGQVDDVITTAQTKEEELAVLKACTNDTMRLAFLTVGVDRQEVDVSGTHALSGYGQRHGIPVASVVTAEDIIDYFTETGKTEAARRITDYLRVFGATDVRKRFGRIETRQHPQDRGIVIALDTYDLEQAKNIVRATADSKEVVGYKTGAMLMEADYQVAREHPVRALKPLLGEGKWLIHDRQKAGTDIPRMGRLQVKPYAAAGVDAFIIFPFSGAETRAAFIYGCVEQGVVPIVGGEMTHGGFMRTEGGQIGEEGAETTYAKAAEFGVRNFVVPGTKPHRIERYVSIVREALGDDNFTAMSPGLVTQGGEISDAGRAAGKRFYAIMGSEFMSARDPAALAKFYGRALGN